LRAGSENEFLDRKLGGGVHRGYICVFNNGDDPGFDWDKGGRLYSQGHNNYQQMSGSERLKLTIGGEPVCEIDIRASYLTIFHALHGEQLSPVNDPYNLPGLGEEARATVKAWFLATFGHDRHLKKWPKKMVSDYREETGKALGKAYPIRSLRDQVIKAYPVLARWGEPFDGRKLGWAELMYREASAVQAAMFTLKDHGIASFTVHDSLIVARSAVSLAVDCLAEEYHRVAGTEHIALVAHCADEPDQLFIPHRVNEWELEDETANGGRMTEPEPEAENENSWDKPDSEALHDATEPEGDDDPFYDPTEDLEFEQSQYGSADDEEGNERTGGFRDPAAAYRAPPIEWLKRDMLPPGRSHYRDDDDDEDRG
jgi:hypothetical protein